ncbi:MAG: hypothetical protein ACLT4D_03545 [Blautia faecis]
MRQAGTLYTIVNSGAYAGDENPVGGKSNMDKLFMKVNVTAGIVIAIAILFWYMRPEEENEKVEITVE